MGERAIVGGVIIDWSVLIDEFGNGNGKPSSLKPSAQSLLRKLRHSKLRLGISSESSLSGDKVNLLKETAVHYSCNYFLLSEASMEDAVEEITLAWGDIAGSVLYLVSRSKQCTFQCFSNVGWQIVVLDFDGAGACDNSDMLYITRLEELPLMICQLNRKAMGNRVVIVGYIMKPSREEDFAKRGAFPMYPTSNGLIFLPLTFDLPLQSQLQHVDIIMHKATDEIISVDLSGSSGSPNRITFTRGMRELQGYIECHSQYVAIDPLDRIYPVLDRLRIQQFLAGLEDLNTEGHCTIRGPHFLKVNDFNEPDLVQKLSEAKLSLPSIVKPQVACGVSDAHSMAIVFRQENFKDLSIPLPAVVQEYVDHSSTLFKIYVLGEKTFYAVKKSIPNSNILLKSSERNGLSPLVFDSLKSLPTSNEQLPGGDTSNNGDHSFDPELVTNAAKWLGRKLDLTIFGFDVVIQVGTGDHVIVDVNYLPSFKEVPDDVAIPAFWDAIKQKFLLTKRE